MPRSPSRLRDWLFGSPAKRLLLVALLEQPTRKWTKQALAEKVGVHPKGGVAGHLVALEQMRLVQATDGLWQLANGSGLIVPLADLLKAVERLPDEPVRKPGTRS